MSPDLQNRLCYPHINLHLVYLVNLLVIDDKSRFTSRNMLQFIHFSETSITTVRVCSSRCIEDICWILDSKNCPINRNWDRKIATLHFNVNTMLGIFLIVALELQKNKLDLCVTFLATIFISICANITKLILLKSTPKFLGVFFSIFTV